MGEVPLKRIYSDYGRDKLAAALSAVSEHLKYYEPIRRTTLHGIRKVYEKYLTIFNTSDSTLYPDELPTSGRLSEGIKKQVTVNSFERNPKARIECINYFGTDCSVCGFNFQKIYGNIGTDFIHVHHLTQLATIGEEYEINPIEDLRPVCPNCHSMLHRKEPPYSIEELKQIIKTPNKSVHTDAE
jgi:5-methylcytosine-specific restriction protein A